MKSYKKEQYLQIYIPLIMFVLMTVALIIGVILVSGTQAHSISHWGNISAVVVIVPLLINLLILLLIIILIIVGVAKLTKWVPIHLSNLYVMVIKLAIFFMNGSNKITSPIINSRAKLSSFQSILKKGISKS